MQQVPAPFDRRGMNVTFHFRNGFGFDIEHTEDICHVIGVEDKDGNEVETVAAFTGIIVRLPLMSIYLGEWAELDIRLLET